jgi:ElaB/YqjD/DUF883 family membrane-anchored ribosome-binding protein
MSEQLEGSGGSAVGEKVDQAKDVVSAQATEVAEHGRGMVREQLSQRSTELGDRVGSASQTLRRVAEQSRVDGNDQQARLAEQAADRGERLSAYLTRADGEQMLAEAEDFARRQPWVIAGAGLAVGLVVARALKASSGTRYQQRYVTAYSAQSTYPRRHEAGQAPQPAYVESPSRSFGSGEGDTAEMDIGASR